MTKQSIITADEARFPLAKLVLSPMNPRQNVPAAEVEELAESIWTAGLIQNLAGIMDGKGGAEIVAGGRRLRALQLLAERHPDLAQVRPELANPPVRIAPDDSTAQAWAVAENAARRVDLLDGELARLDDGRRDDAVGAAEADGNADLDRLLRRNAAGHGSEKRDASG